MLAKRNMAGYGKRRHPLVTLNDLPKPEGDFFALHAKRESKNNMVLIAGIVSLASALYVVSLCKIHDT